MLEEEKAQEKEESEPGEDAEPEDVRYIQQLMRRMRRAKEATKEEQMEERRKINSRYRAVLDWRAVPGEASSGTARRLNWISITELDIERISGMLESKDETVMAGLDKPRKKTSKSTLGSIREHMKAIVAMVERQEGAPFFSQSYFRVTDRWEQSRGRAYAVSLAEGCEPVQDWPKEVRAVALAALYADADATNSSTAIVADLAVLRIPGAAISKATDKEPQAGKFSTFLHYTHPKKREDMLEAIRQGGADVDFGSGGDTPLLLYILG